MILPCLLLAAASSIEAAPPQTPSSPKPSMHAPWSALLKDHVRDGLVDYDSFAKAPSFGAYLDSLSKAQIGLWPSEDRLAFWINAYNAYTIQLINQHQERRSIRNINKAFGLLKGKGPWKEEMVRASGRSLTLDDVEHKIIRVEFKEPRIHMALVCAALSCPPLRLEAYEGSALNEQLDDQARVFLKGRPKSNRLDLANRTIYLSSIFDWYRDDFGKTDAALLKFAAPYFEQAAEAAAFSSPGLKIVFTEYDWSLNILKPAQPK